MSLLSATVVGEREVADFSAFFLKLSLSTFQSCAIFHMAIANPQCWGRFRYSSDRVDPREIHQPFGLSQIVLDNEHSRDTIALYQSVELSDCRIR
jgi:hypothetical protein